MAFRTSARVFFLGGPGRFKRTAKKRVVVPDAHPGDVVVYEDQATVIFIWYA